MPAASQHEPSAHSHFVMLAIPPTELMYVFGPFRVDPTRGLLLHGREIVPLPERLFALLLALIRANENVVSKRALASMIWHDGEMSDGNLNQHVYMLRRILGERARDRLYIMTVHSKGYRFAAPVSAFRDTDAVAAEAAAENPDDKLGTGLEVLRHYSQGRYQVEKRTFESLRSAIDHFEAALQIDPDYVPALVGLARAHAFSATQWYVRGSHAFPKATSAVVRALEIDPASGAAHAVLSDIRLFSDWNWREARREIEIAVRLSPNVTAVRTSALWFYECSGANERSMSEIRHALILEPSSPALQVLLGRVFVRRGDYQRAVVHFSNLIDSGPEFAEAHRYRAAALILDGRPAEALADLRDLPAERAERVAAYLPLLARAYAGCGDIARAHAIYTELESAAHNEFVVFWNLAVVAAGLGRLDEAIAHLEKAYACREPSLPFLRTSRWFDAISESARFKTLLRGIGP